MKKIKRTLPALGIMIGLLTFNPGIGLAQESETTVPGLKYGSPETFAEFHGFVNLTYFDFEKDGERNNRGDSSFDQHYFYFNASAKVRHNVKVLGSIEYEHGGEVILIDQAFIDWGIVEDVLNLQLGKFYSPFGLELGEYQHPVRKLVTRPLMARNLLFNEWIESGVNVHGRLRMADSPFSVDYSLAVVNGPNDDDGSDSDTTPEILEVGTGANPNVGGTGDARQNRDNNSDRTLIGRLGANIPGGISLGVSYSTGRYSDANTADLGFSLIGVDANLRVMGLDLRGEWAKRSIDVTTSTDRESYSYYVQSSYKYVFARPAIHYIEPVVRYDFLNPGDPANSQGDRERISLGINYSPYPHFKFGTEWQINNEDRSKKKDNGFLLQAVVDF